MDSYRIRKYSVILSACISGCALQSHSIQHAPEPPRLPPPAAEPIVLPEVEIKGEKSQIARALERPNIGVIGPSDVFPGHIAAELQRLLRERNPESVVKSYGIGGQDSALILKRFRKQIVGGGHSLVVISGLTIVNEYDAKNIYGNFPKMFDIAKEAGIPVVVYGPTPFAGLGKWNPHMQKKADDFDLWLRKQDGITYVDTSSLGTPVRPGGPLKLTKRFDSGDGIHPSREGAHETARLVFESALAPHL